MLNTVQVYDTSISAPTSLEGASKLTLKQNSILVSSCLHVGGKSPQDPISVFNLVFCQNESLVLLSVSCFNFEFGLFVFCAN